MTEPRELMTPENFAGFGTGEIAFVKAVPSEEIHRYFPNAPAVEPGRSFWALLDAAGAPLMISDSRDAIVLNAREHDLEPVSLH